MLLRNLAFALLFSAGTLGLAACEDNEGPAERAGESIDNATDRAGEAVEDAGDRMQEEAE